MSTLRDLYFGKINPDKEISDSETYDASVKSFMLNIELLRDFVPRDSHEQLDDLIKCMKSIEHEHGIAMFKAGFALAMRISAESYCDNDDIHKITYCPFAKSNYEWE